MGVIHLFLRRGIVEPLPQDAYAAYFQNFHDGDRTPVTTFPRELVAAQSFLANVEDKMKSLEHLKSLIVWGEQDFAFGDDFRLRFESYFPDHRTVLLPRAGHFIQEDAHGEIAVAIRDYFSQPSTQTRAVN